MHYQFDLIFIIFYLYFEQCAYKQVINRILTKIKKNKLCINIICKLDNYLQANRSTNLSGSHP